MTEDGDDGAIYNFWSFIEERRRRHKPDFDLADVAQLLEAIEEFDREVAHP